MFKSDRYCLWPFTKIEFSNLFWSLICNWYTKWLVVKMTNKEKKSGRPRTIFIRRGIQVQQTPRFHLNLGPTKNRFHLNDIIVSVTIIVNYRVLQVEVFFRSSCLTLLLILYSKPVKYTPTRIMLVVHLLYSLNSIYVYKYIHNLEQSVGRIYNMILGNNEPIWALASTNLYICMVLGHSNFRQSNTRSISL